MAASAAAAESSVRKRRVDSRRTGTERVPGDSGDGAPSGGSGSGSSGDPEKEKPFVSVQPGTYWLTRIVLLRAVAFIYFVAFAVAFNQNKQLIGENGLMPCKSYLNSVKRYVGGKIGAAALAYTPSVLWFLDWSSMDTNLDAVAWLGMALSGFVLVTGMANMVIMVALWVLYHSLVNVGQLWYSFGKWNAILPAGLPLFLQKKERIGSATREICHRLP